MIVQCENCQTKYNLPEDKIPAKGAKVKCSKCSHTFMVHPPKPAEPEPSEVEEPLFDESDMDDGLSAGMDDDFDIPDEDDSSPLSDEDEDSLFSGADEDEDSEEFEDEDEEEDEDEYYDDDEEEEDEDEDEDEFEEDDEDDEYYDDDDEEEEDEEGSGMGKKIVLILLVLIILGTGGAAGAWYMGYLPLPFLDGLIGGTAEQQTEETALPPKTMAEQVAKIALKDVKQYYLSNEKAGQLFVVEGKAVNNFNVAKELIKVQASLLDGKDTILTDRTQMCGNTLSMYQLQMEPKEKIEEALNNEVGILANNTFIKPGKSTPFMVVFFNPPKALRAFKVQAVEAHDPPKEEDE